MKTTHIPVHRPVTARRDRRIAGHAQQDHILDPYQGGKRLHDGMVCPQCGAVYHDARWQWMEKPERPVEELCAACRRINDKFPAGILTLRGGFAFEHKEEILHLARHQEEAEKKEHPLNRIISIEGDAQGIVINTTGHSSAAPHRRGGQARLPRQARSSFRGGRLFRAGQLDGGAVKRLSLFGQALDLAQGAWPGEVEDQVRR
jgi:hypothetical protein